MPKGGSNRGKGKCIAFLRANVDFDGPDCLLWPYGKGRDGYGQLGLDGKMLKAHRWMCEAINGPAPEGANFAAHECGKGHLGCVHPKHLKWKTRHGNAQDTIRHGTTRTGKGRKLRKLTHEQVLEIIAMKGKKTSIELGSIYGVHERHIRLIQAGGSWRGGLPHKTGTSNLVHEDLINPRLVTGEP